MRTPYHRVREAASRHTPKNGKKRNGTHALCVPFS